ncbi:hypothetical protein BGZ81_004069 [Podila clonocystis]|nr:hypothetical protein BGZ81_004069 [Podila clonocystis]
MKFAAAIIATAVAAVASAKFLETPWNFPAEGPCVAACTDVVGKSLFRHYNDVDSNGTYFLTSLAYTFEFRTCNSRVFMAKIGICIASCENELEIYTTNYPLKKEWYMANKGEGPGWAVVPRTDPCTGYP